MIADDKIKGIGNGRKAQLVAYNIETAYDVLHGDLNIPRFGPASQQALLSWAHGVEAAFRFDPSKDVPEVERRALVLKFKQRQMQLKGQMEKTVLEGRSIVLQASQRYEETRRALTSAKSSAEKAWADLSVF